MPILHLLNTVLIGPSHSCDLVAMIEGRTNERPAYVSCRPEDLISASGCVSVSVVRVLTTQTSSFGGLLSEGGSHVAGRRSGCGATLVLAGLWDTAPIEPPRPTMRDDVDDR